MFEPSERFWRKWGLILNAVSPSYHLAGVSHLPLDVEYPVTITPALHGHRSSAYCLSGISLPLDMGLTQEKRVVTLPETDPDLSMTVQEYLMEAWVSSGPIQGQGC